MLAFLERQSGLSVALLGLLLVGLVGAVDHVTGAELSFSIFYLLPVSLLAWLSGRRDGMAISLASAAVWLAADLATHAPYSHPLLPYWNAGVRLGFFVIVTLLLSALKAALAEAQALAVTDPLTGAANRRGFARLLAAEMKRARQLHRPFTIAYLDIDDFKAVNDRLGHGAGDALLCTVAETIGRALRARDTVARVGGDEFAVLLSETGQDAAQAVLRRVRETLLDMARTNGWPVTFSIGAVVCSDAAARADDVMRAADLHMYAVKRAGKNEVRTVPFDLDGAGPDRAMASGG